MRARAALALSTLLAASAAGPPARAEDAPERPEVDIDLKRGDVRVQAGPGASVPLDFPKDIPIYPDSVVLTSVAGTGKRAKQEGYALTLQTKDSPAEVVDFYLSRLGQTWRIKADMDMGGNRTLIFTNDDGTRLVQLGVIGMDSKRTTVTLVVGRK